MAITEKLNGKETIETKGLVPSAFDIRRCFRGSKNTSCAS